MALIAGVDIGNSTTEIVIADGKTPVAWDRRPTRGIKGSESSVRSAAALLRNIERKTGFKVDQVNVAPWYPVASEVATIITPPPKIGKVHVVSCADYSVVGDCWATGIPWDISTTPPRKISVIAIVMSKTGYKQAAERINRAIEQGTRISAVIVADDEAVLIASRLSTNLPIVDKADCQAALTAKKLFIEVRPAGQCVSTATDVWALQSALGTQLQDAESVGLVSRWVRDLRAVVIGLYVESIDENTDRTNFSLTLRSGETLDLASAIPQLLDNSTGSVSALNLETTIFTRDVWGVDIDSILANRGIRLAGHHSNRIALASLSEAACDPPGDLSSIFETPVKIVNSESEAALIGARATPGLPKEAVVLDIGGGTIDLVGEDRDISVAGAGELLTTAVAEILGVPRGAADWIKKGPAQRVDSAQVLLSESGSYNFVSKEDAATISTKLSMLVTPGPVGLLPFGRGMQPAEWRIIRQSLKLEIIARNVSRILRTYREQLSTNELFDIVIVGGPAEDDELLPAIGRLPEVRGLGRGNVAGVLGHRFAVAYGLSQFDEYDCTDTNSNQNNRDRFI
jgi:hypothetical protein